MRKTLLLGLVLLAACATPAPAPVGERPKVSAGDLDQLTGLLKRDLRERGQAKMDRVQLDELQRLCNLHGDSPPAEVSRPLEDAQLKAIKFPEGSLIGD